MNMLQIILIVFAIPVAVWILSSLLRAAEEERPGNRPRVGPGARGPNAPRPRRPASDIDSFLEEVNRRRREGAERQGQLPAERPLPTQPARPRMPVPRAEPVPRRLSPSAVPVPRPARIPVATAQPVDVVVVAEAVRPAPGRPAPVAAPTPASPSARLFIPTLVKAQRVSAAAPQLMALLRSPQGLRTAVLLQEVFGPPLCQRQGRTRIGRLP
ncbi:MAG TPA: hypothetical protein VG013_37780 [Gemmataceae bacterium]|jgi:hypothetical protein|nr:hypothetical protein [Gemmataceae bacterium]